MKRQAEKFFHCIASVQHLDFKFFLLSFFVCLLTKQTYILAPENCNLPSVKFIKMTGYQGEDASLNCLSLLP